MQHPLKCLVNYETQTQKRNPQLLKSYFEQEYQNISLSKWPRLFCQILKRRGEATEWLTWSLRTLLKHVSDIKFKMRKDFSNTMESLSFNICWYSIFSIFPAILPVLFKSSHCVSFYIYTKCQLAWKTGLCWTNVNDRNDYSNIFPNGD